ncbi:MAG: TerB family tellurite resistance protein [Magnetospirillum sp.]|nr:TerB family tellurite resistance protein [Magnetospirillum sp.]
MTPLEILATALAYVIVVDGKTQVEEKAKLVTLLGKHVSKGEMAQGQVQAMTQAAFATVQHLPLARFLSTHVAGLSAAQKAALLLNLYDVVAVDGVLVEGERWAVEEFERVVDLDDTTRRLARKVLLFKNDTSLFTNPLHPHNDPAYGFWLGAARGLAGTID